MRTCVLRLSIVWIGIKVSCAGRKDCSAIRLPRVRCDASVLSWLEIVEIVEIINKKPRLEVLEKLEDGSNMAKY